MFHFISLIWSKQLICPHHLISPPSSSLKRVCCGWFLHPLEERFHQLIEREPSRAEDIQQFHHQCQAHYQCPDLWPLLLSRGVPGEISPWNVNLLLLWPSTHVPHYYYNPHASPFTLSFRQWNHRAIRLLRGRREQRARGRVASDWLMVLFKMQ